MFNLAEYDDNGNIGSCIGGSGSATAVEDRGIIIALYDRRGTIRGGCRFAHIFIVGVNERVAKSDFGGNGNAEISGWAQVKAGWCNELL